jgi:2-deoxy-D-gluconate 3-dehydrogenase
LADPPADLPGDAPGSLWLAGRAVLVTGASQGIGRSIAEQLGALGADVGLVQRGGADATVRALEKIGRRATVVRADLSEPEAAERAVLDVADSLGRLDACICSAGTIHREPALTVSLADWQRVIDLNLVSTFAVARAAARKMIHQGSGGAIVLISSVLAYQGGLNVSAYAASKAAVTNLARSLANEWSGLGIRVNALAPGYIANEQTRPVREDPVRKAEIDVRIPARRWGESREIASAVAFLLSDGASYINGTTLVADGGWLGR